MRARIRALAGESLIYGVSGVIARFLTIFLVPIYTRLFTPEDYGVLSLVGSSVAVVSIFVGLGLDNAAHRWFWDTDDELDRRTTIASWAWCQLLVALAFGLAIFVSAGPLARAIVGRADAKLYFRIAAGTLPLGVLGIVLNNWLRMHRRAWPTTIYALSTTLLTITLTLLFVVGLRWGLAGVYTAQVLGLAAGSVVAAAMLREWITPRLFDRERLRTMLRYSTPLIPAALAYWVVGFADRYFVKAYTTTAEVGLYSVGSSLAGGVALVTGAFQQAWGPFAFSIHQQPDARRTYATVFLLYLWIGGAISAALSLFAPEILRLLATARYAGASTVVGILAMSYVMIGLTYIAATGPSIAKRTGPTGVAMLTAAVLNVILNVVLVPILGKVGSAIATLIAQSLTPIYLFYRSQQLYHIPYRFATGASLVLCTMTIIVAGGRLDVGSAWVALPLKGAILLLYVPLAFALRLVSPRQAVELYTRTVNRFARVQA